MKPQHKGPTERILSTVAIVIGPSLATFVLGIMIAVFQIDAGATPAVEAAADGVWNAFFWPVLLGIAGSGGILWWRLNLLEKDMSTAASAVLVRLGDGDAEAALARSREAFDLTEQAEQALAGLTTLLAGATAATDGHLGAADLERICADLRGLKSQLATQGESVREASMAVESTLTLEQSLHRNLDGLSHSAEESSSSVLEMVAINNEVRDNIHNLAMSVQETTSAIEEMAMSSKEVARNIEELSTAAEETAASMNEMDVSISQVETNANETSKLSETVTHDAETGVSAITQTINGIDKIKESSRVAAEVIDNLGQKIADIGNILNVIDDVAEQTNLLALNAAIIAAQAGEHGRGFAVVADEIKALAERTGASTKEIAELVKTIQEQSRNAIDVMSKGVDDVQEGVRLSHNAEDALRKIVDSAKRSTLMIQAIAQATVEQAKGSKQVTGAISRIAETVQQIALATAEQAKGSEHIMQSAEQMKVITQQVERSADEQNRGGQQITQSIENIREMIEQINSGHQKQTTDHQRMANAAARVQETGDEALKQCELIESAMAQA